MRTATLVWLLASLALVIAPHALRLPAWIPLLCALLGAWRTLAHRRRWRAPRKSVLLLFTLACAVGVYLDFGTLFGRDAGVALLTIMLGLKLLETQRRRDIMVVVFLAYFLVITNFLYSQSIPMALYMLVAVLVITGALIDLNLPETRPVRVTLRLSVQLLAQAAPIALLLFILFPRIPGPLWSLPNDAHRGVTGLTDRLAPGSLSRLSESNAVAFRASFEGPPPPPAQRYWRGPVLWHTDGMDWTPGRRRDGKPGRAGVMAYRALGRPLTYTVILEPDNRPWLFTLGLPASVPPHAYLTPDFQLLADKPVTHRIRYRVSSYLRYDTGSLSAAERARALQLPAHISPRVRALASSWRGAARGDAQIVNDALLYFRGRPFVYTLTPPPLGRHPVADFLFKTRKGFCEHYAASFALLMRIAGIPSRVITGYLGGKMNPLGDYMIVRQSDAHAWVEVWLKRRGWVRVDPTAAVAPQRIDEGIDVADIAPAGGAVRFDVPQAAWLARAWRHTRLAWDAANYGWDRWVLAYGPRRQLALLARLGLGAPPWQVMALGLLIGTGALLLATGLLMLRRRPARVNDPAAAAYRRFCSKLARRGLRRAPGEGPLDFERRIADLRPDLAAPGRAIIRLYVALRYGAHAPRDALSRLRRQVRAFRP
ncbi:MAG: DUF3488 domain-containing transglutaminase family protein [Gammaproteobacteria bacterium]|nr:DUF3488 domain-containing transglutaminase family protein [Gammaproteobacteria bacterium]